MRVERWSIFMVMIMLAAVPGSTSWARTSSAAGSEPRATSSAAAAADAGKQVVPATPPPATGPLSAVRYTRVRGVVTGGFQLSPPRITDSIQPGSARDYVLTVWNQTGHRRRFVLDLHDLVPATDAGYAELGDLGSGLRGAGKWVRLGVDSVLLDNLQQAEVPIRVAVPDGADAGGHYAGIRVTSSDPLQASDVRVETAIVAHVVVIVPGAVRYAIELDDVRAPRSAREDVAVTATVRNTGNVHTSPSLRLRLRGAGVDDEVSAEVPELLPGGSRTLTLEWDDRPAVGRVEATLAGTTEDGVEVRRDLGHIWLWDVRLVLGCGIAVFVLVIGGGLWWRRSRMWRRYISEVELEMADEFGVEDGLDTSAVDEHREDREP